MSHDFRQAITFEPSLVAVDADLSQIKLNPSPFTIERRLDTPFFENTYFSVAPVRTADHFELIQQFEAELS